MTWSDIKWSNYLLFLQEKENLKRFPLLAGVTPKEWAENDQLAVDLFELIEDKSFEQGKVAKKVQIGMKTYKSKTSISFAYGLVAIDYINKFFEKEDYITENLYAHLAALHFANNFDDEEITAITNHFNDMSVAEFWPIGNFFFLKYEELLRNKMILENNAMLSQEQ